MTTHDVTNQPPVLEDIDLFAADPALVHFTDLEGGSAHTDALHAYGSVMGSAEAYRLGELANRRSPELVTHDRFGHRIDRVDFHPAWHDLLRTAVAKRVHSLPWVSDEGGFVARAAMMAMMAGVEAGHGCPISMTSAVVPALRHAPELASTWEPKLLSTTYDPTFAPVGSKDGALMGMGMTEKQGGSDVRATTTAAHPIDGTWYRIVGHKWFTSAPMSDAFVILAQAPGGLTCFFLPRHTPDGSVNPIRIQRIKDKVGNRSNASAELEFEDTVASRVGEEGRGVATIIEMVNGTRLDCVSGSVGLMRQALMQAGHHCAHRAAFGSKLIDKPAMQMVLADLEVEVQAATALMTRLAGAFDRAAADPREKAVRRILTPVAKYWVTKRCTAVVREAMECLGGNGYVEESILPRIYRESPLNAIWEGSGNVIALDVVRAIAREPEAVDVLLSELDAARAGDDRLDRFIDETRVLIDAPIDAEAQARRITERLALAVQGALLVSRADGAIAEAFLASRLTGDHGGLFGAQPLTPDVGRLAALTVPHA